MHSRSRLLGRVFVSPPPFVTALLGVVAFWAGMLMAEARFPTEFDWRYMTVSSLLSPARNPMGHLWASSGIVTCGLFGAAWARQLAHVWGGQNRASDARWMLVLCLGNFCMAGAALLPDWVLRIPKGHEMLALLAFLGLCLGMVRLTLQETEQVIRRRLVRRRARWYASGAAAAALLPILLAGLAQAYVRYALPELRWVSLSWRENGVPVYLSFAFWEWATCLVLSLYTLVVLLVAQQTSPRLYGKGELDQ